MYLKGQNKETKNMEVPEEEDYTAEFFHGFI